METDQVTLPSKRLTAKGKQRLLLVPVGEAQRPSMQKSKSASVIGQAAKLSVLTQAPTLCITMPNDNTMQVMCSASIRPSVVGNQELMQALYNVWQQHARNTSPVDLDDSQPMQPALSDPSIPIEHVSLYDENADDPSVPYCDTVNISLGIANSVSNGKRRARASVKKASVLIEQVPSQRAKLSTSTGTEPLAKHQRKNSLDQVASTEQSREPQQLDHQPAHSVQIRIADAQYQPQPKVSKPLGDHCRAVRQTSVFARSRQAVDYANPRGELLVPVEVSQLQVPSSTSLSMDSLECAWGQLSLNDCLF